jgi:type IV pilus assembly protein PilN
MIRINLLPYRKLRKTENIRRQLSIFLLTLILIGGGFYYFSIILSSQRDDLSQRVASIQKELQSKKKMAQEVDDITKKLDNLKKKTEVITVLTTLRKEPVKLIAAMTELVVPKQMWFTNLTAGEIKVDVSGVALDNRTVAEFMTRIEESPLFDGVKLISTQQSKIADVNLKSFTITFNKTLAQTIAAAKTPAENQAKAKGAKP